MKTPISLLNLCRELRLPSVADNAVRLQQEALRQNTSLLTYLEQLLELEVEQRQARRADRRIKEAGFPLVKTLEGFAFERAPHLPEVHLRQLAAGDFIKQAAPVIFLGEPGTGKTHLATALGVAAATLGHSVRFVTAAALVTELVEARDAQQLGRVVARYGRCELLIIDELGYLPLSATDAELLFRVLGERQERRAMIVTTNLPFSEWTTMFPDPRLCRAIIDRLTHRATIIETGTQSIRLQDTLALAGKAGRAASMAS